MSRSWNDSALAKKSAVRKGKFIKRAYEWYMVSLSEGRGQGFEFLRVRHSE